MDGGDEVEGVYRFPWDELEGGDDDSNDEKVVSRTAQSCGKKMSVWKKRAFRYLLGCRGGVCLGMK